MALAFLVKHNARDSEPLANRFYIYRTTPQSLTNRRRISNIAAEGNWIYVVETVNSNPVVYRLGYKFLSTFSERHPTGGKWEDKYCCRNISSTPAEGQYFEDPILITDKDLHAFVRTKQGMVNIPAEYAALFDAIFNANTSKSRKYA